MAATSGIWAAYGTRGDSRSRSFPQRGQNPSDFAAGGGNGGGGALGSARIPHLAAAFAGERVRERKRQDGENFPFLRDALETLNVGRR